MHTFPYFLIGGASLLLLSALASKASGLLGIPSLVIFIGMGMLAGSDGPGGIYFDDPQAAQGLGIIALIFILFSGGFETVWSRVRPIIWSALSLSTLGVLITSLLVGWIATYALHFSWLEALLLGAIVSSTDAAAVFSVLDGKKTGLRGGIKPLLEFESGSNDPMAVFLTIAVIRLLTGQASNPWMLIPLFIQQMVLGAAVGFGAGKLTTEVLNRIKLDSEGLYPVITTAMIFLIYGISDVIGGSGFLTVYVAGVVMGNSPLKHKESLKPFHDAVAWLMQIVMFLTLGLLAFPRKLVQVGSMAMLLAAFLILVARPLGVFVALSRSRFHFREKALISWIGLRGAVPIVLATYPLLAKVPQAEIMFDVVFFIVLTSVVLQGMSIRQVAKWLHMENRSRDA